MLGEVNEKEVTCKQKIEPIMCDNCGKVVGKNFEIMIGDITIKKANTAKDEFRFTFNAGGGLFNDIKVEAVGFLCSDCTNELKKEFEEMVAGLLDKYKIEDKKKASDLRPHAGTYTENISETIRKEVNKVLDERNLKGDE